MGANTLRALTSDLAYLEAGGMAATETALPWPVREALPPKVRRPSPSGIRKSRSADLDHDTPAEVGESLRGQGGPHAPATLRRRLANWSTPTKRRGLDGAFTSPAVKSAIRLAVRAGSRTRLRKSAKPVTGTTDSLRDLRDRAILMVAFASGGRRHSEIAGLRLEQLTVETPIPAENRDPLPSLAIQKRQGGTCALKTI